MTPRVSFAKTRLDYPLYAAEFDPYSRGYLLVSGGGGESKTGVANKITLLDISNPATIDTVAELDLSRDEDSANTLASLATPSGLITFAGINSGVKDQQAGKNEHLRTFEVDYPKRGESGSPKKGKKSKGSGAGSAAGGRIASVFKTSLLKPDTRAQPEAYQRVLRLSPARRSQTGSKRLGAIATGLGEQNEVLLFNPSVATPTEKDVVQRVALKSNAEARDVDLIDLGDDEFRWGYCTDYDVFLGKVKYDFVQKRPRQPLKEPEKVYSVPPPDAFEGPGRLKFRTLRFLTPSHVLVSGNMPSFKGVQLLLLKLYPHGSVEVVLRKNLARHVKATTGMDVCALDADPVTGARQVVVAVAGQDNSVSLMALDYHGTKSDSFGAFRTVSVTNDVHALQITGIRLSPFHAPSSGQVIPSRGPRSSPKKKRKAQPQPQKPPGTQYIHLATISMGNTVVVDTMPLETVSASNKSTRYVLSSARSAALQTGATTLAAGFAMLFFLLALQGFVAVKYPDSAIGQFKLDQYIPESLRDVASSLAPPGSRRYSTLHNVEGIIAHPLGSQRRLQDFIDSLSSRGAYRPSSSAEAPIDDPSAAAVIVRPTVPDSGRPDAVELSTELHPDRESVLRADAEAKKWEELSHTEKEKWKRRLVRAGAWAVDEGESVLKGIFFSSYAGAVGSFAAEAMKR